jgi:hypothetical protein
LECLGEILEPTMRRRLIVFWTKHRLELDERAQSGHRVQMDSDVVPEVNLPTFAHPPAHAERCPEQHLHGVGVSYRRQMVERDARLFRIGTLVPDECSRQSQNLAQLEPAVRYMEIGIRLKFDLVKRNTQARKRLAAHLEIRTAGFQFQVATHGRFFVLAVKKGPGLGSPMASPRLTQPWHTGWSAIDAGLEQRNLGHRDFAAEADVYVGAGFVTTLVIVAVVMQRFSLLPKAQGQRSGIERTEDDVRVGRFRQ